MSGHGPEEIAYGRKWGCMSTAIIAIILFVLLLIYVYNQNFVDVPGLSN